jgi:hypothetical protein
MGKERRGAENIFRTVQVVDVAKTKTKPTKILRLGQSRCTSVTEAQDSNGIGVIHLSSQNHITVNAERVSDSLRVANSCVYMGSTSIFRSDAVTQASCGSQSTNMDGVNFFRR